MKKLIESEQLNSCRYNWLFDASLFFFFFFFFFFFSDLIFYGLKPLRYSTQKFNSWWLLSLLLVGCVFFTFSLFMFSFFSFSNFLIFWCCLVCHARSTDFAQWSTFKNSLAFFYSPITDTPRIVGITKKTFMKIFFFFLSRNRYHCGNLVRPSKIL